ncbi:MAG: conjugative transposon protein TraM [Bacteroidota bacterium]
MNPEPSPRQEIVLEELEQAQKQATPKKRQWWWYALGGVLLLGLLGFGFSYRLIVGHLQQAKETPLPPAPSANVPLEESRPKSRVEQYEEEWRTRNKRAQEEAVEADRLNRIAMSWDQVYQQEGRSAKQEEKEEEWPEGKREQEKAPASLPARYQRLSTNDKPPISRRRKARATTQQTSSKQEAAQTEIEARRAAAVVVPVAFNTLSSRGEEAVSAQGLISAVTEGSQKVMAGQAIKFRLTQDFYLGEQLIPKNTPVVGLCRFGDGRVQVQIQQLVLAGEIIPVELRCFDQDLLEGIAYADPRLKQRSQQEANNLAGDAWDQLLAEVPYAGALLMTGKNVATARLRDQRLKVRISNNYRVYFKLY